MTEIQLDINNKIITYITTKNNKLRTDFNTNDSIDDILKNLYNNIKIYIGNKRCHCSVCMPNWIDDVITTNIHKLCNIISKILNIGCNSDLIGYNYIYQLIHRIDNKDYDIYFYHVQHVVFLMVDYVIEQNNT